MSELGEMEFRARAFARPGMMAKNRWRGLDQPPTELALMLGEAIFVRVQQHQIAALLQGR